MRGRSLSLCLDDLRAELKQATQVNLGQAARDQLIRKLQSAQSALHIDKVWPHKRIWEVRTVSAGQRYYNFPTRLKLENLRELRVLIDSKWSEPLSRGVGPEQYNAYNSDNDERADPVQAWDVRDVSGVAMIELHPMPLTSVTNGLSLIGAADLLPFVDDADVCDLDSDAIVLTAAADWLEREDVTKSQLLRAKAATIVNRLVGGSGKSKNRYSFSDGLNRAQQPKSDLRVVYAR